MCTLPKFASHKRQTAITNTRFLKLYKDSAVDLLKDKRHTCKGNTTKPILKVQNNQAQIKQMTMAEGLLAHSKVKRCQYFDQAIYGV